MNDSLKAPKLVIFDCDGVLVDSEPISNAVFSKHLQALGLTWSTGETMSRFMGRSMKSSMEEVAMELKSHALPIPKSFPSAFLDAMQKETFEVLAAQVQAVEDVEAVIHFLRQASIAHCVASSGEHQKMEVTLGRTGLLGSFTDRIFSATQVANGKPAPDLFLFAALQMNCEPADCWVVEDSPYGVEAAVAAGMSAIAYCGVDVWQRVLLRPGVQTAVAAGRVVRLDLMQKLVARLAAM